MSRDIVLYVSEENNCRLVYRYDIQSGCANFKEQLLVLDEYDNKCAGLWFNTTDYETPFNSAVKALVAATPDTEDYFHKLKKLFVVMLDSGYSSMEAAEKLSPLLLKNPDLALQTYSKLKKKLEKIERTKDQARLIYEQYTTENIKPSVNFEEFLDRLVELIKRMLIISAAGLSKDTPSSNLKEIYKVLPTTSDQGLFSKLNRDYIIEHRNDTAENRSLFDRELGLVVCPK